VNRPGVRRANSADHRVARRTLSTASSLTGLVTSVNITVNDVQFSEDAMLGQQNDQAAGSPASKVYCASFR